MRWTLPTLVGVVASLGVCGCSFPGYAFLPVEDTGAGVADAPSDDTRRVDGSLDAAGEVADSAVLDDADASDSGVDVQLDTRDAPAGDTNPVGRPCTGVHSFCEDFDEASPAPMLGFDVFTASTGSSVGLETSFFASPPRSFYALLRSGGSSSAGAFGTRRLSAPTTTATTRIDVDLYLEAATYSTESVVFRVQRVANYHGVGLAIDPSGLTLKVDGATAATFPLPSPPLHTWFHVRLDATLLLTDGAFAVYFDDLTTPVLSKDKLSTTDVEEVGREAFFGPYVAVAPSDNLRLRFDDIVVDFLP